MPLTPECVVEAVEAKVAEHLQRTGRGPSTLAPEGCTAKRVLSRITDHQGAFLKGIRRDAIEGAVTSIASLAARAIFT